AISECEIGRQRRSANRASVTYGQRNCDREDQADACSYVVNTQQESRCKVGQAQPSSSVECSLRLQSGLRVVSKARYVLHPFRHTIEADGRLAQSWNVATLERSRESFSEVDGRFSASGR